MFFFEMHYSLPVYQAKRLEISDPEKSFQILLNGLVYPVLDIAYYHIGKRVYDGPDFPNELPSLTRRRVIDSAKYYLVVRGIHV